MWKKVGDKAVADDIVQEVFLKVHANIGQLKDADKLSPWIYKITRNSITDYFRKKSKSTAYEQIDLESDDTSNKLNECVAHCLQQLVLTLPEKYKEVFEQAMLEWKEMARESFKKGDTSSVPAAGNAPSSCSSALKPCKD